MESFARANTPKAKHHADKDARSVVSGPASVITSGQARHASSPDCKCHRHCGRIEHSGSTKGSLPAAARFSCSPITRSTIPHLPSVHCTQPARLHVLLNRNRFSGERPCRATSTKASSITMRSFENATEPSASTIPIRLAPASHPQLGQRIVESAINIPPYAAVFARSAAVAFVTDRLLLAADANSSALSSSPPFHRIGRYK
jgi:hypothetical protein